jgi:hypothetical protein
MKVREITLPLSVIPPEVLEEEGATIADNKASDAPNATPSKQLSSG